MPPGRTGEQTLNKGVRNTVIILSLTALAFYFGIMLIMRSAGS